MGYVRPTASSKLQKAEFHQARLEMILPLPSLRLLLHPKASPLSLKSRMQKSVVTGPCVA